ncbi:MAG TPA: hypothetical protein VNZ49_06160 [Bacteroidia bacterium]|jgi:hypothetical protein|nr:hypothetical protein [Bacteroidia bacterium]
MKYLFILFLPLFCFAQAKQKPRIDTTMGLHKVSLIIYNGKLKKENRVKLLVDNICMQLVVSTRMKEAKIKP